MPSLWDRREPRTSLNTPVTVWHTDRGRDEGVALDVSLGGMFVSIDDPMDRGDQVVCQLSRGDTAVDLSGQVAWARPEGTLPGMGLSFQQLSDEAQACIRELVGSSAANGEPVRVRFEGMEPVRARAWVAGAGIRVATALPFLRLGSQTELSVDGAAPARGVLDGVRLAIRDNESVPHLEIDIALPLRQSAESEDVTPAPHPEVVEIPQAPPAVAMTSQAVAAAAASDTQRLRAPRRAPWLVAASAVVVCGAVFVSMVDRGSNAASPGSRVAALSPALDSTTAPPPETPVAAAQPAAARASDDASGADETPSARVAAAPEASIVQAPATQEHPVGNRGTVRIQLSSPPTGSMDAYPLAEPNGVAVNLPGASLADKTGVFPSADTAAHRVWLRHVEGGAQIRVLWGKKRLGYRARLDGGELVIELCTQCE